MHTLVNMAIMVVPMLGWVFVRAYKLEREILLRKRFPERYRNKPLVVPPSNDC